MEKPKADQALSDVAQGAASVLGTRLVGISIGIVSSVITARALGPSGRGILVIVTLVPTVLQILCNGGLQIANIYFLGQKRFGLGPIVSQSLTFGLISSVITIGLFWAALPFLRGSILRDIDLPLLVLAASTLPMVLITAYSSSILLGIGNLKEYNLLNLGGVVVELVAIFLALVVCRAGIVGAVGAIWIGSLITTFLGLGLLGRKTKLRLGLDKDVLLTSLRYGLKGQTGNIIQFLNYRLDTFLVSLWLTPKDVGYYALAVSMAEMLRLLPGALQTVLFPKMSSVTLAEANHLAPRVFRVSSVMLILGSAGLLVLGRPLIQLLYGAEFLPALPALQILLPAIVVLMSSAGFTSYLGGRGYVIYNTWGTVFAFAATLILDILLIPRWGIVGAAFASLCSYTVTFVVAIFFFIGVSRCRLAEIFTFRHADWIGSGIFVQLGVKEK